jgi:hypothetical protein
MEFEMTTKRPQITVTVPKDVRLALEEAAQRQHRTVSNMAQHLLATALANPQPEQEAAA